MSNYFEWQKKIVRLLVLQISFYGEKLYLSAHYVRPESQHKGYGTRLLEAGLKGLKTSMKQFI